MLALNEDVIKCEDFRIYYNTETGEVNPFPEDIKINYKPSNVYPIIIQFPIIPVKFYADYEIKRLERSVHIKRSHIEELRKTANSIGLIPKHFDIKHDKRIHEIKRHRYIYAFTYEDKKIYYPCYKATLENFTKVFKIFSDATFTLSFLDAFEKKILEHAEINSAKETLVVYSQDLKLIPESHREWNKDYKPFNHQKLMMEYGVHLPYFANLSEMGTGKTYPTILAIKERLRLNQIDKAFILAPKSILRTVWAQQIKRFAPGLTIEIIIGTANQRINLLKEPSDIYIIGYESFNVMVDEILPLIDDRTMFVLDESSKIKNPSAKRSKALHKISRLIKYKIILNGTPITQGAQDIFSQFLFLDGGERFGTGYQEFLQTYFYKPAYKGWKWKIKSKEALDAIADKIYEVGLRYLKEECMDLPPKQYEQRDVIMTKMQWKSYLEMRQNMLTWIHDKEGRGERIDATVVVTKLLRLSQITSGFSKNESGQVIRFPDNPKLIELENILEEQLYNGNQLVIWARFIPDIEAIGNLLDKKKIKYGCIYGAIKDRDREKAVKDFLDGKIKVFVGQQGSGGLGIDLYTANTVVYFSNDYTLLHRLQSEDRTHRAGSEMHKSVTYIDLVANGPKFEGTIDYHILNVVLKEKKNIADVVTRDNLKNILSTEKVK
jgi:SNF2 family DNA or RNA helicase